ncbi:predicted protein [Sclerotinia sclerotiorum 1980 UF-70]|uniref:Uncharacterized protein n=1 Tax=Sclerotinia sclerotiorum (strain ATCC 18683 / 1980 / Ss-1) TaxID=665079 RepID=A7EFG7_SCLS1|nr:predicted protein [Sclerotinia sclerotiorum 1980 UF-70]EDO01583.1 predicted protein [Sclerotinia sclerotiorum 1980 UF-70]
MDELIRGFCAATGCDKIGSKCWRFKRVMQVIDWLGSQRLCSPKANFPNHFTSMDDFLSNPQERKLV